MYYISSLTGDAGPKLVKIEGKLAAQQALFALAFGHSPAEDCHMAFKLVVLNIGKYYGPEIYTLMTE